MYADGVRLCLKDIAKIRNYKVYDSYALLFDEEIDQQECGHLNLHCTLLDLYLQLCGAKVTSNLPCSKFHKLGAILAQAGGKFIEHKDLDLLVKQTLTKFAEFDFYAFLDACKAAARKSMPASDDDAVFRLAAAFSQIQSTAKEKPKPKAESALPGARLASRTSARKADRN